MRLKGSVLIILLLSACNANAQDAVQWQLEDGGNGHWYGVIGSTTSDGQGLRWDEARISAIRLGGELVSISTESENQFVFITHASNIDYWYSIPGRTFSWGPWVGGYAMEGSWSWSDGSKWTYSNWAPGEPFEGVRGVVQYYGGSDGSGTPIPDSSWDNTESTNRSMFAIVEWSADCNGDGLVDYGQIRNGELQDRNGNGVPDICESCLADLNGDDVVDFFDISAFLTFFSISNPTADWTNDGVFDFFDVMAYLTDFAAGCV
jgi:hypothetical protein